MEETNKKKHWQNTGFQFVLRYGWSDRVIPLVYICITWDNTHIVRRLDYAKCDIKITDFYKHKIKVRNIVEMFYKH